jgi:hypothetical protein
MMHAGQWLGLVLVLIGLISLVAEQFSYKRPVRKTPAPRVMRAMRLPAGAASAT